MQEKAIPDQPLLIASMSLYNQVRASLNHHMHTIGVEIHRL